MVGSPNGANGPRVPRRVQGTPVVLIRAPKAAVASVTTPLHLVPAHSVSAKAPHPVRIEMACYYFVDAVLIRIA